MKLILSLLLFVSCSAISQTVNVSGRLFYDVNGNEVFDGNDSVLANRPMYVYHSAGQSNTTTNAVGQYAFSLPLGDCYISMSSQQNFDQLNYQPIYYIQKNYTAAGSDIVNFAFQKRDSVESIHIYSAGALDPIPATGITKQFKFYYGYNGYLPSMPATFQLRYNPSLSFLGSTTTPTLNVPGKLEWLNPSLSRNTDYQYYQDSIVVNFTLPATGDTIDGFMLTTRLIPNIPVTVPHSTSFNFLQYIERPDNIPVGSTRGVKWLRHTAASSQFSYDNCVAIDTTLNGDGYFVAGSKTFDNGSGISGNKTWLARLNKDGLSIWEKYPDSVLSPYIIDYISGLKHTPDGGFVIIGSAKSDTGTYNYDAQVSVVKFDQSGNLLWRKNLNGSSYDDVGYSIEVLPDGSIVFSGSTGSNDGDFLPGNPLALHDNVFVTKLSPTGAVIFTKVYGGSASDYAYRIKALQNGTFLLLGVTESNNGDVVGAHQHFTIDPVSQDSVFSEEAWVLNLDASGNIIWSRCYGGSGYSYLSDAAENGTGILLAGYTDSKNGDLSYYPEFSAPLWALQISNTGNIIWSKLYKTYKGYQDSNFIIMPGNIYYSGPTTRLLKTSDGGFVVGGSFHDKYGSIKAKHGSADFVLIKLNASGDIVWQKAVGGTNYEEVADIQSDRNGDIVFVGNSSSEDDDLYQHRPDDYGSLMMIGKIGITNVIKGQVFVDDNGNHIKDAGERYYSQGRINSVKATDTIQARIFNGQFLNNVDTGSYVTKYVPVNNYYTIFPAQRNSVFSTFDLQDSFDVVLAPIPNIKDLEVQLLPLSTARPGFDAGYRVITKNVGTATINNVVIGFVKDSRQEYADASRPETGMAADSIWWGPFTLNAFDIDTLYITLTNNVPPLLNNGDTLSLRVTANPVLNDSSVSNNVARIRELVRGSFDPNDKAETHAGTLTTTQYTSGEYLQYLVRFQNTGTDTAFFITVKDTLQSRMDLSSMEILSASHPFQFRLDGNIATWDFKNINLADSITDEPASHGFILFKIKPKTGLAVGDTFVNSAAIYFDYNLPVITNQNKTIIGNNRLVCPNGNTSFAAGISGTTYQWQINTGSGFTNLANGGIYSGVNTPSLSLTGAPTSLSGYKYRCLVNGTELSPENKLRFGVEWTGAISNAWNNAGNWDCNNLPDAKTEVIIPTGAVYPSVTGNVSCYSLSLSAGSMVTVVPGAALNITGKVN